MATPAGQFFWYELMTRDAAAALDFYAALTGWRAEAFGDSGYRVLMAGDEGIGGVFTLTDAMVDQGARPGWLGYIHVTDADAAVAAITAAGGSVLMPAQSMAHVGRIAMVADPQGGAFYVMTPDGPDDAPSRAFRRGVVGHCGWNELTTADPDAAFTFYSGLFGWTRGTAMPMGPGKTYQLVQAEGEDIGAIAPFMQDGQPTAWLYYFHVAGVDTAIATIGAKGGQVMHGPVEVPGGDHIVIGSDPEGAVFAVVGPRG